MGIQKWRTVSYAVRMHSSNTYRQRQQVHTKHWHPITNTHHTGPQSECPQFLRHSLCSSVSTVTSLWDKGPTNLGSIFGSNRDSAPRQSAWIFSGNPLSLVNAKRGFFLRRFSGWGAKPNIHRHLVERSRTRGAISPRLRLHEWRLIKKQGQLYCVPKKLQSQLLKNFQSNYYDCVFQSQQFLLYLLDEPPLYYRGKALT